MMFHLFSDEENEILREEYQDTLLYKWLYKPCSDFAKDDNTTYLFLTPEEVMYLMMEEYGSKAFQTEIKEIKGSLHPSVKDDVSYMAQLKSIDAHIENQLRDCVLRETNCSKQELREKYMSDVLANKQLVVYALMLGLIFMNSSMSQIGAIYLEQSTYQPKKILLREYFKNGTFEIDNIRNRKLTLDTMNQYMKPTYTIVDGDCAVVDDGECTSHIGQEVKSILLGEGLRFVPLKTLKQGKSGKEEVRELKVKEVQGEIQKRIQVLKAMKALQERVKELERENGMITTTNHSLSKAYDKLRSENEKLVKENASLREGAKAGTAEEMSMTPIRIAKGCKGKIVVLLSAMYYADYFKSTDNDMTSRDHYLKALLWHGFGFKKEKGLRQAIDNYEESYGLENLKHDLRTAFKKADVEGEVYDDDCPLNSDTLGEALDDLNGAQYS